MTHLEKKEEKMVCHLLLLNSAENERGEHRGLGQVEGRKLHSYLLPYSSALHPGSQSLGGEGETYQSCAITEVKFKQLSEAGGLLRLFQTSVC